MDKSLFGCKFMAWKLINENEFCLESCDILASPIILGCIYCMLKLKKLTL
jgi:hypothetical protein